MHFLTIYIDLERLLIGFDMFEDYYLYQKDMLKRIQNNKYRRLAQLYELLQVESGKELLAIQERHRRQEVMRDQWKKEDTYSDGYLTVSRISPQLFKIRIDNKKPIALQRPRMSRNGHVWDCQKRDKLLVGSAIDAVIKAMASQYVKNKNMLDAFFNNPVDMVITFFFEMPKSWSDKKKHAREYTAHTQKPDLSNLLKFYEDAMNEIMYKDDSQIYNIVASKRWARNPGIEISLSFHDELEQKNYNK